MLRTEQQGFTLTNERHFTSKIGGMASDYDYSGILTWADSAACWQADSSCFPSGFGASIHSDSADTASVLAYCSASSAV